MTESESDIEQQIVEWRRYLEQRNELAQDDIAELEDHLRGQIGELAASGLSPEEAFLVAIKRLGRQDVISREFALEHTDRLWKQLVLAGGTQPETALNNELFTVLALAVAAAVSLKIWDLTGLFPFESEPMFYFRNAPFFVMPWLCGYFYWKRQLSTVYLWWLIPPMLAALVVANSYPYLPAGNTYILSVLHLPIVLWLLVGYAYAGDRWASDSGRMDFVRFTGELAIYYVLIALGGWVFIGLTFVLFSSIGMNPEYLVGSWIVPGGVTGAFIIAAWLVEAKQGVIENIVPVLTHVFTPLFTLLLAAFLVTMLVTGQGVDIDREVLIAYDLLLVLVLGLLLYSLSARDPHAAPGMFDYLQLALVCCALLADLLALAGIAGRITEFGFSPNRLAALGENLILLVNLLWSAIYYYRFLKGQSEFTVLIRWQMAYLPVYAGWAAGVVVVFPPLFSFL
ncbi:MAG: hypothetical protein HOG19_01390 [Gammaproteobacteria bacterium]|nr:hypothetical protein [Gammaproteobacteria bacterium]